jgi:hypothetical protein
MNRLETRRHRVLWRGFVAPHLLFVIAVVASTSTAMLAIYEAYDKFEFEPSEKAQIEKLKADNAGLEAENATLKAEKARLEADKNALKEADAQAKEENTKLKERPGRDSLDHAPNVRPLDRGFERQTGKDSNSNLLDNRKKGAVEDKDRVEP